ncbi:MAG: glycoside hydrolase family 30 protein, partial [Pseudomonadales bacterium]|nr:glycoside hydrolase family 30 protein [Pseudomonadales bacterium]
LAGKQNRAFFTSAATGIVIEIDPAFKKQNLLGIGTSFTESSAFVLAHLSKDKRTEVMQRIYGAGGANFAMARTPIGSTDFSVEGKYSYAEQAGDVALDSFSIDVDKQGFSRQKYPGIQDENFDVLPMIQQALAIKHTQQSSELRIIASAWTAPPWMKTIEDWYIKPSAANNYQGTGGELKPEHLQTYANYIVKYLDAYLAEGVQLWGVTPVNEPHGNSGQWESMHFTPETQNSFIKQNLGPALLASRHADTKLLVFDQNRDGLERWADVLFSDAETAAYVYGAAVHWYESTVKVYEDVFENVHARYPQFAIIHTEGTIDDLGKEAPEGILDPVRYKESGWFKNDDFWWNANATDWAYTASWAPKVQDHPIYTPVHRYARNIIVSLDHWVEGWIDWNIVLDKQGGPNHVGNFCGAPIMIDTENGDVYYTPIYYVLAQLSQTIRPGDVAVQTHKDTPGLPDDALHACASVNHDNLLSVQLLNTTKQPIDYALKIGAQHAAVQIDANAIQTVRIQL